MKIICPECQTKLSFDSSKTSSKKVRAKCPKCGGAVRFNIADQPVKKAKTRAAPEGGDKPRKKKQPKPKIASSASERKHSDEPAGKTSREKKLPTDALRRRNTEALRRRHEKKPEESGKIEYHSKTPDVGLDEDSGMTAARRWVIALVIAILVLIPSIYFGSIYLEDEKNRADIQARDHSGRGAGALHRGPDMSDIVKRMRIKIKKDSFGHYYAFEDGPEYPVMTEILINCDRPCELIDSILLGPLETKDGFSAKVECGEASFMTVKYYWSNNTAFIDGKACQ